MLRVRFAFCAALFASSAFAQTPWPKAKPVSIVVAFAAGSSTDIMARVVGTKLAERTGGQVVIENKGGAGGNIATAQVKRAAGDGYTLLAHSVAYAVNPSLYANAGYDALHDFAPVALGPRTPNILSAHPAQPIKDVKALVELAKKQPLSYASSGIGTTTHLSVERLKTAAKIELTHVPYQPAAAITAVVGGHVPISSTSLPPAVPQIKAGTLRALAVTSAERSPLLPDVPSLTELGYPEFDDYTWFGFFAPIGAPAALIEQINREINLIYELPEVKAKFAELGMFTAQKSAAEFGAFLRSEVPKWAGVIKATGAKAE